jgi:HTH-type transcriptional regulator/antitoxin HigA
MKNYTPAEVFPPGEFLKEELEARGWSQVDLAEILGRPPRLVSEIISGKRAISPETAQGLGDAFGVDPQYWLNLESAWQLWRAPQPDESVAKRAKLYEMAPIKEMARRHWIESTNDACQLEARLLEFFETPSIDCEPEWAHAARKSSSYAEGTTPAQKAWLCRARHLARMIVVRQPYSEKLFDEMLAELRKLLMEPEEIRHVPRVLADYGIRFLVNEPLTGTRIDGACFWLNSKSPVVVLALRFDRIDAFWFTLLHELGHVRAGDGQKTATVSLDTNLIGEGATRSEDKPEFERKADEFATAYLLHPSKLSSFIARIRPLYSKEKIRAFAKVNGVHPGIVVGQLQHRGEITWAHNREMLAKVRDVITRAALTDGWGATPIVH